MALASTSPRVIGLSAVPRTACVRCVSVRPFRSRDLDDRLAARARLISSSLGTMSIRAAQGEDGGIAACAHDRASN